MLDLTPCNEEKKNYNGQVTFGAGSAIFYHIRQTLP